MELRLASGFLRYCRTVEGFQSGQVEVVQNRAGQIRVIFEPQVVAPGEGFHLVSRYAVGIFVLAAVGVAHHRLELLRHQIDVATYQTEHFGVVKVDWS